MMNMNFCTNKTAIEVIKERAFGGTYFRDIYSGINDKWYEFDDLKNDPQKYYWLNYYEISIL